MGRPTSRPYHIALIHGVHPPRVEKLVRALRSLPQDTAYHHLAIYPPVVAQGLGKGLKGRFPRGGAPGVVPDRTDPDKGGASLNTATHQPRLFFIG